MKCILFILIVSIICCGANFEMPPRQLAAAYVVWTRIGNADPEKDGPACKPPLVMLDCARETYVANGIIDVIKRPDGAWEAVNIKGLRFTLPPAANVRLNVNQRHVEHVRKPAPPQLPPGVDEEDFLPPRFRGRK